MMRCTPLWDGLWLVGTMRSTTHWCLRWANEKRSDGTGNPSSEHGVTPVHGVEPVGWQDMNVEVRRFPTADPRFRGSGLVILRITMRNVSTGPTCWVRPQQSVLTFSWLDL